MHADRFEVGDPIAKSPVGAGTFTEITDAGWPRVNGIAVVWMEREDGARYDPLGRAGGTRGPSAEILVFNKARSVASAVALTKPAGGEASR
jgi:hypothetical protein